MGTWFDWRLRATITWLWSASGAATTRAGSGASTRSWTTTTAWRTPTATSSVTATILYQTDSTAIQLRIIQFFNCRLHIGQRCKFNNAGIKIYICFIKCTWPIHHSITLHCGVAYEHLHKLLLLLDACSLSSPMGYQKIKNSTQMCYISKNITFSTILKFKIKIHLWVEYNENSDGQVMRPRRSQALAD